MKKFFALALSSLLVFSLVACGGGKKNGIYTAKVDASYAEEFGHGWTDQLTVTYQDDTIVYAEFNSYNAEGVSKADDPSYAMDPSPSVWMPELSKNILDAGSSDTIVAVAGATSASDNAKILLAAIEKDGKPGETITVTMPVTAD